MGLYSLSGIVQVSFLFQGWDPKLTWKPTTVRQLLLLLGQCQRSFSVKLQKCFVGYETINQHGGGDDDLILLYVWSVTLSCAEQCS